jgi:hypothetical protein
MAAAKTNKKPAAKKPAAKKPAANTKTKKEAEAKPKRAAKSPAAKRAALPAKPRAAAKRAAMPRAAVRRAANPTPAAKAPRLTPKKFLALADDPATLDSALAAAMAALPEAGRRQVVAAWSARVAAGDAALVTRLLAMFELTALAATDAAELAPFIEPLREAGASPEVFPHVEHAMASEHTAVREAVCARWLADARAQTMFDSSQIDKLVRCAVALAEAGDADRDAANLALSRTAHPGGRQALMEAIRNGRVERNPELLESLYAGLVGIGAPDLIPFLIERLFEERAAYSAVVSAIARVFDNFAHRHVLSALTARARDAAAVRAATLYADAVAFRGKAGGRLVELARTVIAWTPSGNDDARRLRRIFELALDAALSLGRTDEAHAFLARARELPDAAYSDYHVLAKNARTPALLDEPHIRRYLASLEA